MKNDAFINLNAQLVADRMLLCGAPTECMLQAFAVIDAAELQSSVGNVLVEAKRLARSNVDVRTKIDELLHNKTIDTSTFCNTLDTLVSAIFLSFVDDVCKQENAKRNTQQAAG